MNSRLFHNGIVWLGNGLFAESFGIKDGRFSFTGSNTKAYSVKGDYDESLDLKGKLVIPSFHDGHVHLVKGSLMRKVLNCSSVKSAEDLKELINNSARHNTNQWILGTNLNINLLTKNIDGNSPLSADEIYHEKPFFITNYDYHSAFCNTKAFTETGLIDNMSIFGEDEIDKYQGKPTGIIREKALYYITDKIPQPDLNTRVQVVREFIKILHSYGITAVSDITLPEDLDVYNELFTCEELKIRINSYLPFSEFGNINSHRKKTAHIPEDLLTIRGFKAFWDGALGSQTALYSMNYRGKDYNGYRTGMVNSGEVYSLAGEIDSEGYQIAVHAIGDLAVKETLDMLAELPHTAKRRHRIEHCQHIQPSDILRFAELGVIASVQPVHLLYDQKTAEELLPADLVRHMHNYRGIVLRGGVVNFGTDFPIADINPFENIRYSVTRADSDSDNQKDLCFSTEEAINCYTAGSAYATFSENITGSIRTGFQADFIILENNIFEQNTANLTDNRVLKTYFNGDEVFSADL